jgi:hypothetical protein
MTKKSGTDGRTDRRTDGQTDDGSKSKVHIFLKMCSKNGGSPRYGYQNKILFGDF